jgi:hypothetical protein
VKGAPCAHCKPSNANYRITALNAVSLVCGIVGNVFLLFNFTHVIRYIIALPVTIILWFIATGIVSYTIISFWDLTDTYGSYVESRQP